MKRNLPKWSMFLACCCLVAIFFFPLWKIRLDAPQFPGGLRLDIWVNQLSGSSKHIIQNINILNHYIGMKFIDESAIPELRYFPYVIYGLLGLGLVTIVIKKPAAYLAWSITLSVFGVLGVYDFYLWLYDYGHNLDPKAPIYIPGMTYMPPLIGGKYLLNFYAFSYPWFGTFFLLLAIGLSFTSFWLSRKRS